MFLISGAFLSIYMPLGKCVNFKISSKIPPFSASCLILHISEVKVLIKYLCCCYCCYRCCCCCCFWCCCCCCCLQQESHYSVKETHSGNGNGNLAERKGFSVVQWRCSCIKILNTFFAVPYDWFKAGCLNFTGQPKRASFEKNLQGQ